MAPSNRGVAPGSLPPGAEMLQVDGFIELLRRAAAGDKDAQSEIASIEKRAREGDESSGSLIEKAMIQTEQAAARINPVRKPEYDRPMGAPPVQPMPETVPGGPYRTGAELPRTAGAPPPIDPAMIQPGAQPPAPGFGMSASPITSPWAMANGADTGFTTQDFGRTMANILPGTAPSGIPSGAGMPTAFTPPAPRQGGPPPQQQPAASGVPKPPVMPASVAERRGGGGLSFDTVRPLPDAGPMGEPLGPPTINRVHEESPPPAETTDVRAAQTEQDMLSLFQNPPAETDTARERRERKEVARGLVEFGLATMAAADQPGASTLGAIGQGGVTALGRSDQRRSARSEADREERRWRTEQQQKYRDALLRSEDRRLGIEQRRDAAAEANETRQIIADLSKSGDAGDQARIDSNAAKFFTDLLKLRQGDDPDLMLPEEQAAILAEVQRSTADAFPGAAISKSFQTPQNALLEATTQATDARNRIMASDLPDEEKQRRLREIDQRLAQATGG